MINNSTVLRKIFGVILAACLAVGCSSTAPVSGKPLPQLTFASIEPLYIHVGSIDVETVYVPGTDPKDVSSSFPTPPDIAIRRYAENRLKPHPAGYGTLKLLIEDATVYKVLVKPESKLVNWSGVGDREEYEVSIKLRLYTIDSAGQQGLHSMLNLRRKTGINANSSLAEKEYELQNFTESLILDADAAVTEVLRDRMRLADAADCIPMASLVQPASGIQIP